MASAKGDSLNKQINKHIQRRVEFRSDIYIHTHTHIHTHTVYVCMYRAYMCVRVPHRREVFVVRCRLRPQEAL